MYKKRTCYKGTCQLQKPGLCVKHKRGDRCNYTLPLPGLPLSPYTFADMKKTTTPFRCV